MEQNRSLISDSYKGRDKSTEGYSKDEKTGVGARWENKKRKKFLMVFEYQKRQTQNQKYNRSSEIKTVLTHKISFLIVLY